ncbi:MAG: sulfur carrier protein ThiS, partial [Nitrospirota bacterium]
RRRVHLKVKINGVQEEIGETSIFDLLKKRNIETKMVSVELNSEILEKEDLPNIKMREGDELEFLYFMGGGRE